MTGQPSVVSLFDVENVETMPKVRDMTVGPVSPADVREFARRYHYTGLGNNAAWRWGLWDGPTLHGVVSYNLPPNQVRQSVFGAEHSSHLWHMGRLILSERSPRNSESRLIGGSLRAIEREHPDVWAILTYAASEVGRPVYCHDCEHYEMVQSCKHCNGSGCGPGTASGAYEECQWCAGDGRDHSEGYFAEACDAHADLSTERDALADQLVGLRDAHDITVKCLSEARRDNEKLRAERDTWRARAVQ